MINFFDVVYNVKRQFDSVTDVEKTNFQCGEIQEYVDNEWDLNFDSIDTDRFGAELNDMGVLDVRLLDDMRSYLNNNDPKGCALIETVVEKFYAMLQEEKENKKKYDFSDQGKFEAYRYFLASLKKTDGASVAGNVPEMEESEYATEEATQKFINDVDELRESQEKDKNLYRIIRFVYDNGLNVLSPGMMGKAAKDPFGVGDELASAVPDDLRIIIPVLNAMSDTKAILKSQQVQLFNFLLNPSESGTDKEYVNGIKEADKPTKIITYNLDKILQASENIGRVSMEKDAFRKEMNALIDSESLFAEAASDAAEILGKNKTTIYTAVVDYLSPDGNGKIKSQKDLDTVRDGIASAVNAAIEKAADALFETEKGLSEFDSLFREQFTVRYTELKNPDTEKGIMCKLPDTIGKWRAFMEQPVYQVGFGTTLIENINKNRRGMYKDADPAYKHLSETAAQDVLAIIRAIDISSGNPVKSFQSVSKFMDEDSGRTDAGKIAALNEALRFIKTFFEGPFIRTDEEPTSRDIIFGQYDAACAMIYFEDGTLNESYEADVETMIFEGRVLFEASNWTSYFKRLSDKVMAYLRGTDDKIRGKINLERPVKERTVITYIFDVATYLKSGGDAKKEEPAQNAEAQAKEDKKEEPTQNTDGDKKTSDSDESLETALKKAKESEEKLKEQRKKNKELRKQIRDMQKTLADSALRNGSGVIVNVHQEQVNNGDGKDSAEQNVNKQKVVTPLRNGSGSNPPTDTTRKIPKLKRK